MHLVLLRPAIFAIVLIRTLRLVENTNAASMLPNTATVTLDEQATSVVGLSLRSTVGFAERRARIFLLAAKTSCYLLFIFGSLLIGFLCSTEDFGLSGGVGALAATGRFAHFFA